MPGGLVGQGAEFSRSSCVLVRLTVCQPKRVSISLLSLSKAPPFPSIGMLGLVPGLTQTHTQPEISAPPSLSPSLPPPSSEHIPLAQQRSFHHSGWHWIIFLPLHIPAKEEDKGGERLLLLLCDYIITEQQTCIQYIKHNLSLAYFIWWWLNTSVLLLDPTNWIAFVPSAAELNCFLRALQICDQPWAIKKPPSLIYCTIIPLTPVVTCSAWAIRYSESSASGLNKPVRATQLCNTLEVTVSNNSTHLSNTVPACSLCWPDLLSLHNSNSNVPWLQDNVNTSPEKLFPKERKKKKKKLQTQREGGTRWWR